MPSREGEKGSKMPKMINIASTGVKSSARLDNKPKQRYGLFAKLSLAVNVECDISKNPHIFTTR